MPVSEYICVPIEQPDNDRVSADTWIQWWVNKAPVFYDDDVLLEDLVNKVTPIGGRVVEAGCGQGRWVELLSAEGYDCIGIEYAPAVVEAAKRFFPNCTFLCGDITNLDMIASNTIDTYISWGVFEHFPDGPDAALKEALRILKPGGKLIATVPNHSIYRSITRPLTIVRDYLKSKRLVQQIARKPASKTIWFEYQFSYGELSDTLRRSGFEVLSEHPMFFRHGVHNASILFRARNQGLTLNPLGKSVEKWSRKRCPSAFAHMNMCLAIKPYKCNEPKSPSTLAEIRTVKRCESSIC